MVTIPRMAAERAVASLWPAWLVDVACRAGSTLDVALQEVDIQTLHWHLHGLADARWKHRAHLWLIAHKSLGKNVREQADIDKLMVDTLEGFTKEWRWSKAKLGVNTPLAISMTVCRAGAAVELADNRTARFVMPVFFLNVINDESHAINRLACQKLISVPTGAGSLAEASDHCH